MTVTMRVRNTACFDCGARSLRDLKRRLCSPCLQRHRYWGTLPAVTLSLVFERLVVKTEAGCWEWLGAISSSGYGRHQCQYTHRLSYEFHVGPIPDGLHLDHLCLNKSCCNPEHLEPVTLAENTRRAAALITSCPQGHPYDEENTVRSPRGWRSCRRCLRERTARSQAAKEHVA